MASGETTNDCGIFRKNTYYLFLKDLDTALIITDHSLFSLKKIINPS